MSVAGTDASFRVRVGAEKVKLERMALLGLDLLSLQSLGDRSHQWLEQMQARGCMLVQKK